MPQVKQKNILDMILNSDLRSLGVIATDVITAVNSQVDSNVIEEIILKDAALTAQVIKIANTSKTGSEAQRKNLREAIVRVGYDGLRSICICIGIVENIPLRNASQKQMILNCLQRSFETATHAGNLATILEDESGEAYIAGLLCNIGELAFLSSPIVNLKDFKELSDQGLTVEQCCLSLCGFDFDELSEQIVEKWELSTFINDAFSDKPASETGRAVKAAFDLTRAFHSGQNSKAFIEVSKALAKDFGLSFKDSASFIERGIKHAKAEFSQYEDVIEDKVGHDSSAAKSIVGTTIDVPGKQRKKERIIDGGGMAQAIEKINKLATTGASERIYFSVLSEALYNYIVFNRVVISTFSNNELQAVAVAGADTKNLTKSFSFVLGGGSSFVADIIESKEGFYCPESDGAREIENLDKTIHSALTMGQAFFMVPILKGDNVIALAYMDMGSKDYCISNEQMNAAKKLVQCLEHSIQASY